MAPAARRGAGRLRGSLRIELSANLLENANKAGNLAAAPRARLQLLPEPGCSCPPSPAAAPRERGAAGGAPHPALALPHPCAVGHPRQREPVPTAVNATGTARGRRLPARPGSGGGGRRGSGSRGRSTRLGRDSAESWVGIGSTAGAGRGLGGLQSRHGQATATLERSWKLVQALARSQDFSCFFFPPLPLPRFSVTSSSDFPQLPACEPCAAKAQSEPGELLLCS